MLVLTIHRLKPPCYLPSALRPGRLIWAQAARFGAGSSPVDPDVLLARMPGPGRRAGRMRHFTRGCGGGTVLHREYAIPNTQGFFAECEAARRLCNNPHTYSGNST